MDVHDEKRRVNVFLSSPEIAASVDHNSLPRCLFERVDEKKGKKIKKKEGGGGGGGKKREEEAHYTHGRGVCALRNGLLAQSFLIISFQCALRPVIGYANGEQGNATMLPIFLCRPVHPGTDRGSPYTGCPVYFIFLEF